MVYFDIFAIFLFISHFRFADSNSCVELIQTPENNNSVKVNAEDHESIFKSQQPTPTLYEGHNDQTICEVTNTNDTCDATEIQECHPPSFLDSNHHGKVLASNVTCNKTEQIQESYSASVLVDPLFTNALVSNCDSKRNNKCRERLNKLAVGYNKKYPCQYCPQLCVSLLKLKEHIRTHTGEKPYACDICGKRFSRKSGLKQHMPVHSDARSYQCDICNKSFKFRPNLTRHACVLLTSQSTPTTTCY